MMNLIRTEKLWEGKRREWNFLLEKLDYKTIFLKWEWLNSYWKNFKKGKDLFILSYQRKNNTLALAGLFIEKKFGWLKFVKFLGEGVSDYLDFLILPKVRQDFFRLFIDYLSKNRNKWDIIDLGEFSSNSPNFDYLLKELTRRKFKIKLIKTSVRPQIYLPRTKLKKMSKRYKKTIRNRINRIRKNYNLEFYHYENCNHRASSFLEKIVTIDKNSSKFRKRDSLFASSKSLQFHKEIFSQLKDFIDLSFLTFNKKEVAYVYNYRFDHKLYCYDTSYDSRYAHFSPGKVLIYFLLKKYLSKPDIERIDLGRGTSDYKKVFADGFIENYRLIAGLKLHAQFIIFLYCCLFRLKEILRRFPFLYQILFRLRRDLSYVFA